MLEAASQCDNPGSSDGIIRSSRRHSPPRAPKFALTIYQLKIDTNLARLRAGAACLQLALWCVLATPLAAFIPGLAGFYVFACL